VKTDYDSPWKDILETYFQPALELCFPQIARQINWAKGVQLLSKEFQKIVRRSELGRRNVDVLVQVWSVTGSEQWVLLHVEVQAQRDLEFPHFERVLPLAVPLHRPEQMIKRRYGHAPVFTAAQLGHSDVDFFHKFKCIFVCVPSTPQPLPASQNEHSLES